MKKSIVLILCILMTLCIKAQDTTVSVGKTITTSHHKWTLTEIVLSPTATTCKWTVESLTDDTYVCMTHGVYLETDKGKKIYLAECKHLPMEPERLTIYFKGSKIRYETVFPALPSDTKQISYISSSTFYVKDIVLPHIVDTSANTEQKVDLNATQTRLLNDIKQFLIEEKLNPSVENNIIYFEQKDVVYQVEVSPSDNAPMYVTLGASYEAAEYNQNALLYTAGILNKYKAVKMYPFGGGMSIQSEMLLKNIEPFRFAFHRILSNIEAVSGEFSVAYDQSCEALKIKKLTKDNQSDVTVSFPSITKKSDGKCFIRRVKITDEYTILEFESFNNQGASSYQWCSIDQNTYLKVNGINYKMLKADGIRIAPAVTYYPSQDSSVKFTLYFQPIPKSTKLFDFYENGKKGWWFEGIKL